MSLVTLPEGSIREMPPAEYPTQGEVEQSLKRFAEEIGETTDSPFLVSMVARYGGKPPVYSVVIRCVDQEPIRKKLAEVLNRRFSLGGSSLALDAIEAQVISQYRRAASPDSAPTLSAVASIQLDAGAIGEVDGGEHSSSTSIVAASPRVSAATRLLLQSQLILRRCSRWARNALPPRSPPALPSQRSLSPRTANDDGQSASSQGRAVKA